MTELFIMIGVFVLSFGVGYALISQIPPLLHTPLMSMTNAISAVTILGAFILFSLPMDRLSLIMGSAAILSAAFNLVGGFVITDKMLGMFHKKTESEKETVP